MTKDLIRWALDRREQLKESWAEGHFSASFELEMLVKNAGATGAASAYKELMELEYEDLYGSKE